MWRPSISEPAKAGHAPRARRAESLRAALSYPSALHRIGAFAPLLDDLSPAQFAALNAELAALNPPPAFDIRALFFRRWALVEPETALNAAIKTEDLWTPALMAWGERDPAAALARFEQLTFIQGFFAAATRDALRALAMPKPGQLPPREALRRIRELQGNGEATPAVLNSMSAILTEWTKTDPELAWQEALALPSDGNGRETRERALGAVIRSRAGGDPQALVKWLNALPDGPERGVLQTEYVVALALSGKSRQAREYALAMPEGSARQKAVGDLANALSSQDAEAAKALVADLSATDWRDPSVFREVFRGWLRSDPERATAVLLDRFPADAPAGPEQQSGYEWMFSGWSERHPGEAGEFFLKLPEAVGSKLFDQALVSFSYKDPRGAGEWAAALPPGPTREKAMGQAAENWTRFGATQVTQWLDELPSDSGKSAAIEGFARAIISTSPDDGLAWLRAVPDEDERLDRLRRVWRAWTDREAAQRWVETSRELTDAERSALQEISKAP
jgi:hypothetical protein